MAKGAVEAAPAAVHADPAVQQDAPKLTARPKAAPLLQPERYYTVFAVPVAVASTPREPSHACDFVADTGQPTPR